MTEPGSSPKKQTFKAIAGIGIILILTLAYVLVKFGGKENDVNRLLKLTAAEINRNCPHFEDSTTRLDNAEALDGKKIQYNYTLTDLSRDSIDVELLYVSFETAMIANARENPGLRLFRDNGVTFVYNFKDQLGTFLTKIEIPPVKYIEREGK